MVFGFDIKYGVVIFIGYVFVNVLIDLKVGLCNVVVEVLINLVWVLLEDGFKLVLFFVNWMWFCCNEGEDVCFYDVVEVVFDFCVVLGINVFIGKDLFLMKQKYLDGDVLVLGIVVIFSVGVCEDINKIVELVFQKDGGFVYYFNIL